MADDAKVASETRMEEKQMSVGIMLGWFVDTGEFVVNAPELGPEEIVYLLEQAKLKILSNVSPNRPPKRLVDPVPSITGIGGKPH